MADIASYTMQLLEILKKCILYSAMGLQDIGQAIRTARKGQRRSQAQLARALGMSRATISAIENGTVVEVGVRKVIALCQELGLDLAVSQPGKRPTLQELREERRATKASR